MKRTIAYILLLLLGFQAGGYFLVFKWKQWGIQEEMDRSREIPEVLQMPLGYFQARKERGGREIRWQGKMYDIRSCRIVGDKVVLKAVQDRKEQKLLAGFSNYMKEKDEDAGSKAPSVFKLLKLEWLNHSAAGIRIPCSGILISFERRQPEQDGFPGPMLRPPRTVV